MKKKDETTVECSTPTYYKIVAKNLLGEFITLGHICVTPKLNSDGTNQCYIAYAGYEHNVLKSRVMYKQAIKDRQYIPCEPDSVPQSLVDKVAEVCYEEI